MELTINIKVDRKAILDTMITAIEAGSRYWYYLSNETLDKIREATPDMTGRSLAVRIVEALHNGHEFEIHDDENRSEVLGTLSMKTMGERTNKMFEDQQGERVLRMIDGEIDGEDADIIFQYWVMNEVVFG